MKKHISNLAANASIKQTEAHADQGIPGKACTIQPETSTNHTLPGSGSIKKLCDSEIRYRRLFESAKDGILILDAETGTIIDVNPFLVDLLGLSYEDFLGKRLWELGLFQNIVANKIKFSELQTRKYVRYDDLPLETVDGRQIAVEFVSNVYLESETNVIQCNIRDISGRKAVETLMQLQRSALEAAANAIVITDEKCVIQWVNSAFTTYTGYSSDEAVGRTTSMLKSGRQDAGFYRHMWSTIAAGEVWQGELINRRKDGSLYTEGMTITPLRINGSKITHFVAVKEDITDRKKLEAQLLHTQRMESIGTLAGGIAHDLNNVLAPILMAVEILRRKLTDEADQEILSTLRSSALHGAELVRQVLGFARGIEGERISVDTINILKDVQKIIRDTFPKDVYFSLIPIRDLWTVTGDPTQLQQVFINLCVNARDVMPDGGKLTVTLENTEIDEVYAGMNPDATPGPFVMVSLTDTGTGIPPKILERIFDPFFTTKEVGKGTGMGLSTTIAIVRSHGGFISVHSEMGKGATFKVYLPAIATPKALGPGEIKHPQIPEGNGEWVLLVDDTDQIRAVAKYTLERFGYRVLEAANGAEAVAVYAKHQEKISLILTDMAMPVMDGAAALAAIRVMNPGVKAIASSGLTSNGQNSRAMKAGFKYFIAKPYTAEVMLNLLARVLREDV